MTRTRRQSHQDEPARQNEYRFGQAHWAHDRAQQGYGEGSYRQRLDEVSLKFSRRATAPGHGDMRDAVLVEGFAGYRESEPLVPRP